MGGRVDVAGGAASQRWLSLVPLPPSSSILPQSLSLDLTFLATVVLVLTALSLFLNLPTRKPNWADFSQLMFSRCSPHHDLCSSTYCAVVLFFVSCYAAAVQRGALAQPIQLWLLVAEEKLFRRHTSSFKGDIKDVPKIRKTIKIIFSNYSADTPWLYGGFPLFTCSLKHLSIAYWPILESAWKFISTTAWCKTLGRPTHRNWAVWGCFSHGRRWSPSCTGSPMRHGPDPGIGKV